MSSPSEKKDRIIRHNENGSWEPFQDSIAIEEPLELRIGKSTLAITMRTPGDDENLVRGFLLCESIVTHPREILSIQRCGISKNPNRIRIQLSQKPAIELQELSRYGTLSSSCGICGKQSIQSVLRKSSPISHRSKISLRRFLEIPQLFSKAQSSFQTTGGLHAAALFNTQGELQVLCEDVGRHNAVDKAIGWASQQNHWPLQDRLLMVSGRISFEIVQKALAARISITAGISAPTTLAISLARESNQTLIGFLRPPRFNVYSHLETIFIEP